MGLARLSRVIAVAFLVMRIHGGAPLRAEEASESDWIHALEDERAEVRVEAMRSIARSGSTSVEALDAARKALHDPAPDVRSQAALALLRGGEETRSLVLDALAGDDPGLRTSAVDALSQSMFVPPESAPFLLEAFRSGSEDMRVSAAQALARLPEAAIEVLPDLMKGLESTNPILSGACLHAIAVIGPDARAAVPGVVRAMLEWTPRSDEHAAATLALLGPDGIDALLKATRGSDIRAREAAEEGLRRVQGPQRDIVVEALATVNGDARGRIAEAIFQWDELPATAPPTLLRALEDENDGHARAQLMACIGRLGPAANEALPTLLRIARDPSAVDRSSALRALRSISPGDAEAIAVAMEAIDAHGDWIAQEAFGLLQDAGPAVVPRMVEWLESGDSRQVRHAAGVLAGIGVEARDAIPALMKTATGASTKGRCVSMLALEKMGAEAAAAVPVLVSALSDEEWEVRSAAERALGRIEPGTLSTALPHRVIPEVAARDRMVELLRPLRGEEEHERALLEVLLGDTNRVVRRVAAEEIASRASREPESIKLLIRAAADPEAPVATAALEGIGELGPAGKEGTEAAMKALQVPDDGTRRAAIQALLRIEAPTDTLLPPLAALLGERSDAGFTAAEALVRIGAPSIPHIVTRLAAEDPWVRREAARTLERIPQSSEQAVSALRALLTDPDVLVRVRAVSGLAAAAAEFPNAMQALGAATGDSDEQVALAAARSLGELSSDNGEAVALLREALAARDADARVCMLWSVRVPSAVGPAAVHAVLDATDDPDPDVRCAFVDWLRAVPEGNADVMNRLRRLLRDTDPQVRLAAAWALGARSEEPTSVVADLAGALSDPDREVRCAAAEGLGSLREKAKGAVEPLRRAILNDPDEDVRRRAGDALKKIQGP